MQPPMYGYGAPPPGYGAPGMAPPTPYGMPPPAFMSAWYYMYYQGILPHEWPEITAWFASVDMDRSGSIHAHELARCTFGGFPLGFEVARKICKAFDRDASGSISFFEYAAMHKFLAQLQQAFFVSDRNRSGFIDAHEVLTVLAVVQLQVSLPTVQALFNSYVRDPRGLSFGELICLAAHIASMRGAFLQENLMQGNRGVVTLDMDRLIFLSAKIV